MTRDVGQITPLQAVAATLVTVGLLSALVAGAHLLVPAGQQAAPLEAPAEPADDPCLDAPPGDGPVAVSANQLIECPRDYDGREVIYSGEAVRAVLLRGHWSWVQLNDDPYALELGPLPEHRTAVGGNSGIPVRLHAQDARRITHVGDYRGQGDIIQVTGTFHRTHPADDGGPVIQARTVEVTSVGHRIRRRVSMDRLAVAAVLTLATLIPTIARAKRRWSGRR